MKPETIALGLTLLAAAGSLAGWAAPRLAPKHPRLATVCRGVAALCVNVHGALTAGRPPELAATPKPPEAP